MAVNRFFLLSLNVVILLLLGVYLLNLFGIKAYDPTTMVYLFVASIAVVLISNEFIETYKLSNPIYFIAPGVVAVAAPFVLGKPIAAAIALGWLCLAPGLVLLIRGLIGKKKE